MEKNCLVSIIVPVYNVEKYLRECVDSILSQTYKGIEVILVDDGSADSSPSICDEYARAHSNVLVIHRENGGLSVARNTGLEQCTGEYVYFIDSDDYIAPEAVEELLRVAVSEDADIVFYDAYSFEDGNEQREIKQNYKRNHNYSPAKGIDMLTALQKNGEFHSSVPLMLLRKDFLIEHSLDFVPGILHEDTIFTFKAFIYADNVAYCDGDFYKRRYRPDSIMTSKKTERHYIGCRTVYNSLKDFSFEQKIEKTDISRAFMSRYAMIALDVYKKLDKSSRDKFKDDYKALKSDILDKGAYGNKALQMRCYGKVVWFIYKVFEKSAERLFKK